MKRITLVMALMAFLALPALAQDAPRKEREVNPKERAEEMTERIAERLELNDDQRKELLKANLEMAEFRAKQHRMAMEKKDAHDQRLKTILTEEQYEEYQQGKERIREKAQERRRKHRPSGSVR